MATSNSNGQMSKKFTDTITKIVYGILKSEKLVQTVEWHVGKVDSVISSYSIKVFVDGSTVSQPIPCNPDVKFASGDEVFVQYVNKDPKNKFVPMKRATGSESITYQQATAGLGDMLKSVYDKNNDGIVDHAANADSLSGEPAIYYAKQSDVTSLQSEVNSLSSSQSGLISDSTTSTTTTWSSQEIESQINTKSHVQASTTNGDININGTDTNVYTHPTGDGNEHVPATGTNSNNMVLKAGSAAGSLTWSWVNWSEIKNTPTTASGFGLVLTPSDIPTLTLSKISDAGTAASLNYGTASGQVPILDSTGRLNQSVLPALAITDTYVVSSQTSMLALSAHEGDIAIRTDLNDTFILQGTDPTQLSNWQQLLSPTSPVSSVAGKTGAVILTASDVGLGSVANESPTQLFTSPVFTGSPTAPTPSISDNSTTVATTAYVQGQGYQKALGYTPVNKNGDTMVGFLTLNADPTNPLHATTKEYVDNAISASNGYVAGTTAPTNTGLLWIDTSS